MLRSITLDDADGNPVTIHDETGLRLASNVSGLVGVGAPRDDRRVRPNNHGGIDGTRWEDGRLISIDGNVSAPGDIAGAFADFRSMVRPMVQTWDASPALLKWQEGANAPITNLVSNPSFEVDTSTWTGANGTIAQTNTVADSGTQSLMVTATSAASPVAWYANTPDRITVTAGVTYYGRARFRSAVTSRTARIDLRWYDSSGNVIGGDSTGSALTTSTSAWGASEVTAAAPVGATSVAVILRVATTSATSEVHYVDAVLFTVSSAAVVYHDGDTSNAEWSGTPGLSASVHYPGKQRLVKLASEVDPTLSDAAPILNYQAQFFAEDPRAYSQVLMTVSSNGLSAAAGGAVMSRAYPRTYSQSGGGVATVDNAGNRPTPLVFRIYGLCVNPTIVLVGVGTTITLSGTVPAGSYLELDTQARTVKMNGVTSQLSFLDSANSTWSEAPAGLSQWQLIAASFDASARLDVLARSAYA